MGIIDQLSDSRRGDQPESPNYHQSAPRPPREPRTPPLHKARTLAALTGLPSSHSYSELLSEEYRSPFFFGPDVRRARARPSCSPIAHASSHPHEPRAIRCRARRSRTTRATRQRARGGSRGSRPRTRTGARRPPRPRPTSPRGASRRRTLSPARSARARRLPCTSRRGLRSRSRHHRRRSRGRRRRDGEAPAHVCRDLVSNAPLSLWPRIICSPRIYLTRPGAHGAHSAAAGGAAHRLGHAELSLASMRWPRSQVIERLYGQYWSCSVAISVE